jgi:colicin import membrane protein
MAIQRESSILFSLKALADLERARTLGAALEAQHEAARREHDRAELAEELLRRETSQRLEAMKLALIERMRLEAEAEARLELVNQEREHERRLTTIRDAVWRKRQRQLGLAALAVFVVGCVLGAGVYFGKLRPEADRLQARYDALVAAERARGETTRQMLERAEARRRSIDDELARTKKKLDAAERRITELERR